MKRWKRWLVAAAIGVMAGCTHPGPPKPPTPPTPTPGPPTGVVNPQMVLKRNGTVIQQQDGNAFDFRGAKTCCAGDPKEDPTEIDQGWPVGTKEGNAWLKAQGNINSLSKRAGPFRTVPGGESGLAAIGGGYLEVNGKPDLDHWNPAFWKYLDDLMLDDAKRDQWSEVGIIDGWGLKNGCHAGDIPNYHPWAGTSHCALVFDATQEAWVRKVVEVFGRHGNVTWEVSNESWLVGGDVVSWEEKIVAVIRDEEAKHGYPRHLIATNAERPVPSADWDEYHTNGSGKPLGPKITGVNEYNPEPALSGNVLAATYCSLRAAGVYYWAWRHGMSLVEWSKALAAIKAGCGGVQVCPHPDFADPRWTVVAGQPQHLDELGAAEGRVRASHPEWYAGNGCLTGGGTPPGDDPAHAAERWAFFAQVIDATAFEMRKAGTCAWQRAPGQVEIHSLRTDGLWTELHPIATNNGCKSGTPYKQTWKQP